MAVVSRCVSKFVWSTKLVLAIVFFLSFKREKFHIGTAVIVETGVKCGMQAVTC